MEKDFETLKQIIMVDDNRYEYELSQKIFEELIPHVELIWFPDGKQLIDFLSRNTPQSLNATVVLLDVHISAHGAKEILEEMRAKNLTGKVPVIVMSVIQKPTDEKFYSQFARTSFMKKPCGLDEYGHFVSFLQQYMKQVAVSF